MSADDGGATLAVCCITNAPPAQVEAVFAPFRHVASEYVIVFDDRVPRATHDAYEGLATCCMPVSFEYLERHLQLAHDVCSTDWVFRIDTDEVVSPSLIARLPELIAHPHMQEYRIARRWVFGSPNTWLDESPWYPDHQLRLVRRAVNLRFSGELHSSADGREPAAYVQEPIYHLDCLLNDLPSRRVKSLRYEVLRPGLSAMGGGPMWSYYQPEKFAHRPLAAVPTEDQPNIRHVIEASGFTLPREGTAAAAVEPAESTLVPGIEWLERDCRFQSNASRPIALRITNPTAEAWPGWEDGSTTVLRLRWQGSADHLEDPLILPLEPHASRVFAPVVRAPELTGDALLEITVAAKDGRVLSPPATLRFAVTEPPALPVSREVRPALGHSLRRLSRPQLRIPRVIHRVWLGDEAMPSEHVRFGESWQEQHPDWTIRLWTDADAPRPEGFDRARNIAERADLVRYEVIRQHGGIYVDTDVECLRPIDDLLAGVVAFAAYEVPGRLCNAVIGAEPGHQSFTDAVELAAHTVGTGIYPLSTATLFLTHVLEPLPDVTLFASSRFYPYLWDQADPGRGAFGDAYAVHHWAKSWV